MTNDLRLKASETQLVAGLARHAQRQSMIQSLVGGESQFRMAQDVAGSSATDAKFDIGRKIRDSVVKERLDLSRLIPALSHSEPPEVPPAPTPAPTLPSQIGPWQATIVFDNGVPVGGNASLVLFRDGSYSFSGHFHDSGGVSYDVELVWVVISGTGRAYTFSYKGHVAGHGFWNAGSLNADWSEQGKNNDIAEHWAELSSAWMHRWNAGANWDVQSMLDGVLKAAQTVGAIVDVVVKIVAVVG